MRMRCLALIAAVVVGASSAARAATLAPTDQPAISFEVSAAYCAGMRGGERYALHIFRDGLVIYSGERRVRVEGIARAQVSGETVARWHKALLDGGFAAALDSTPPQDTN